MGWFFRRRNIRDEPGAHAAMFAIILRAPFQLACGWLADALASASAERQSTGPKPLILRAASVNGLIERQSPGDPYLVFFAYQLLTCPLFSCTRK
jgi:hypothetical protein